MAAQTISSCICLTMERTRWLRLVDLPIIIIVFILLVMPTSHTINTNNDLHTLLSFKSLIKKDPLGALSSWSAISNSTSNGTHGFCHWNGVTCSGGLDPGYVTALRLRGFGLGGTISPLLGNLTHLQVLDLSNNKLEGEIPPSLGNCLTLDTLNLSVNFLSGMIPSTMGQVSNLVILNIRKNNISGMIPSSLANLTSLTMFSIADNYVHGQIPPWLGNLTMLTDLNMARNMVNGNVPVALSKLTNLQSLTIGSNKLLGVIPPTLFNVSSLQVFNVGLNQLSGSLPPDIGFTLPNLRIFSIFYNQFEGPIPSSFSNISVLEQLNLHGNRFQGQIPSSIGANGLLTVFEVGKNELQAIKPRDWDFLTSLANCSNLIYINLQLNNLSGILPNIITNLTQELQKIRLGGNQISGHMPQGIGKYYKLTSLEFSDNLFTGIIPSDIGKLSNLHELLLFQNRFHGAIPSSLGNITELNQLLLSSNYLEGTIPVTLQNLWKLTSMDLSNNLLSGQIPQEIVSISSLTILLNLSNNAFDGPISQHIGHLINLGLIDLSSNKLSGEIPITLGSCLELESLYLQGNLLRGQIPKQLGVLRGLEVLDLSNNKLSGPIPEFLMTFQILKNLNLSFNHLSGPVPNKGAFTNASVVSLESNNMLCGGPLFLHFPPCTSLAPDKYAGHQLPYILIFSLVGVILFVIICIAICICIKKSGSDAKQSTSFVGDMYQRISYAELYVATDSFSTENLIGRGSFSSVYRATLISGANFIAIAVKVFDLQRQGATRSFVSECNALKRIRHRKLVKVISVCDSLDHNGNEFKALVLEFISNGSLDKWLHPSSQETNNELGTLSLLQRLNIALDVAEALEYLHHHVNPSIVHCDIKPSNILLDDDMVAHVGDFGLAKIMTSEACSQCLGESSSIRLEGTIGYLPPVKFITRPTQTLLSSLEYGVGTGISMESDIYSYGVLLLEILTGKRPTDGLFDDATSLPKYIEMAYPDKLLEIMGTSIAHNGNTNIMDMFIAPVSRLALACCKDYAKERINMNEVVKELSTIKKAYKSSCSMESSD